VVKEVRCTNCNALLHFGTKHECQRMGRYYPDPVDYTIETMQKTIDRLQEEVNFLRQTLMQDTIPESYLLARERAEAEVERLRVTTGYFYNGKTAEEWAEEVERLQQTLDDDSADYMAMQNEVERLRALWQTANDGLLAQQSEREQDRSQIEWLKASNDQYQAEVERLRAGWRKRDSQVLKLRAEVEHWKAQSWNPLDSEEE
jgi:chromosome segregation ATPase